MQEGLDSSLHNKRQREYRKATNNKITKKYEKSFNGYLMRTYRNMLSRVKGVLKKKSHLYEGLPILDKILFYEWSKKNEDYKRLHNNYAESNFDINLAPSIDRIDSKKGYLLGNMRWITHRENSLLGIISRYSNRK
jgi:hypothetical protein